MPPTSPITQWLGNGCGHAGSSTKPGEEPFFSTAIPSASRSATRAFCSASVADCCAFTEGTSIDTLNRPATIPAQSTFFKNFEVIAFSPLAVLHDFTQCRLLWRYSDGVEPVQRLNARLKTLVSA